jgi:hypothetical protein
LAGPTGAGKTHLMNRLFIEVNKFYANEVTALASTVPMLLSIAVADGARKFNFKRLWKDAAHGLHDPFVNARPERLVETPPKCFAGESFTTSVARQHFEEEGRMRQLKVWGIDEAQHILLGGAAGEPSDQFDVLKSVSQVTTSKLVLCGTHQLPTLLTGSGQVMRRSVRVPLAPYSLSDKKEYGQFLGICISLLKELPCATSISPEKHAEDLYIGCLGCVGVLKDWLIRAWSHAHRHKQEVITVADLHVTRLSADTLITMQKEIVAGRELDSNSSEKELRALILNDAGANGPKNTAAQLRPSVPPSKAAKVIHKRRPGERNPTRDPVPTSPSGVK